MDNLTKSKLLNLILDWQEKIESRTKEPTFILNSDRIRLVDKILNVPKKKEKVVKAIPITQIKTAYIKLKYWNEANLNKNDCIRIATAIKKLRKRTDDDKLILLGLRWLSNQDYSWTIETLDKKWIDFQAHLKSPTGRIERAQMKGER